MTDTPENPRAFPLTVNDVGDAGYEGMTLQDYFAAAALQGLLSDSRTILAASPQSPRNCAGSAYEYADAMLRARSQP